LRVVLLGFLFGGIGRAEAGVEIWVPRFHNPVFAEPGGTFEAEARGDSTLSASGWSASIRNALRSWPCVVAAAAWGRIHHGTEAGWRLSLRVPADAPPELFTLTLAHATGGAADSARAVRVVSRFDESFYILHLSDQHVTDDTAVYADGSVRPGNGTVQAMHWAAPAVNLINPRFVFFTGDNMQIYNEATNWAGFEEGKLRCQRYRNGLSPYDVATVAVPGNHDIGWSSYVSSAAWRDEYERQFGQRCLSFRMGSFYVLGVEWTYDEFLAWEKGDYAAAWSDPSIAYRLVGQHYYDGLGGWTTVPGTSNPCDLMIVGHNHVTSTLQASPYRVVSVGTAQDHHKAAFYDFQKTASGWTCPTAANHAEGVNVFTLFGDWGAAKLSVSFAAANDGTQASNTAAIVNALPQDFYQGRVKFLMAAGDYAVTGATREAQYTYNNGANTAVLAMVTIRRNATTTVSIAKTTPLPPAAPTNLAAEAVSTSRIDLRWTDNATTETGFKIERKTGGGGTWGQIAAPGANVTAYADTGLAAGTPCVYRVRATNAAGDSAYSNEASAATLAQQILDLVPGYTLIALSVDPVPPLTAEGLARQIVAQGGDCAAVVRYESGAFVTHPAGTAVSNFELAVGTGYFVRCRTASRAVLTGRRLEAASAPLALAQGYNLIGLPVEPGADGGYTAERAGAQIGAQGGLATQVVRYDEAAGAFVTHPVGTAVENFALEAGRGYFVRCAKSSTWTVGR
jgi:hypothetical protein